MLRITIYYLDGTEDQWGPLWSYDLTQHHLIGYTVVGDDQEKFVAPWSHIRSIVIVPEVVS